MGAVGTDPGACANGFSEAERVRALATRIKALGGDRVKLGTLTEIIMQTMVSVALTSRMTGKSRNCTWTVQRRCQKPLCHYYGRIHSGSVRQCPCSLFGGVLPGRSNRIVGRDDLANPNRAAARGYSYRLVIGWIYYKYLRSYDF